MTQTQHTPARTTRPGEPSIQPIRTVEKGRLLTQADVDASLRRCHKASRGRAYAQGVLVVVETTRYEDGRSLQTRLLLGEARALRDSLTAAIAEADEAQAIHDLRFAPREPGSPRAGSAPLVAGGQGRTGEEVVETARAGGMSVLACLGMLVAGSVLTWGVSTLLSLGVA